MDEKEELYETKKDIADCLSRVGHDSIVSLRADGRNHIGWEQ